MSNERDFWPPSGRAAGEPADPFRIDGDASPSNLGVGPSVADLPFPYPVSDHQRIANAVWLLDNNPSGQALLPVETDEADAPRFGAVAPPTSDSATARAIHDRAAALDSATMLADSAPETRNDAGRGDSGAGDRQNARTKVTLFYRPVHGTTIMHSYVVAEGDGEKYYLGAFPESDLGFVSNIGQAALDSASLNRGARGRLVPRHGPYAEDVGQDFSVPPSIRVDFDVPRGMDTVKQQLSAFVEAVRKAEIPYDSVGANSNSFAHGAVRALGLMPKPVPSLLAPGANVPTVLSERR